MLVDNEGLHLPEVRSVAMLAYLRDSQFQSSFEYNETKRWAVSAGNLEIVRYLLKEGLTSFDENDLCLAAASNHLRLLKFLTSCGYRLIAEAAIAAANFNHYHCSSGCIFKVARGTAASPHALLTVCFFRK